MWGFRELGKVRALRTRRARLGVADYLALASVHRGNALFAAVSGRSLEGREMNIAAVVAWMWMAAQQANAVAACKADPNCMVAQTITVTDTTDHAVKPYSEHVIEIRTKRHATGKVRACYYLTTGQVGDPCEIIEKPTYCPSGASCQDLYDETREIWIDGKRFGVLKESGQ